MGRHGCQSHPPLTEVHFYQARLTYIIMSSQQEMPMVGCYSLQIKFILKSHVVCVWPIFPCLLFPVDILWGFLTKLVAKQREQRKQSWHPIGHCYDISVWLSASQLTSWCLSEGASSMKWRQSFPRSFTHLLTQSFTCLLCHSMYLLYPNGASVPRMQSLFNVTTKEYS